jgi:hypothetical protein
MEDFYSVQNLNDAYLFLEILARFVPDGATILDAMCGKRIFWRHIPENKYRVIYNDLRLEILASAHFDFLDYPEEEKVDCIIFDPPHIAFTKTSLFYGKYGSTTELGKAKSLGELLDLAPAKFLQLLKPSGIVIAKVFDDRKSGELVPAHAKMLKNMQKNFILEDLIIKSSIQQKEAQKNWNSGRKPRKNSIPAHSYFMVFKKRDTPLESVYFRRR